MTELYLAAELQTYSLEQLYALYRRFERELLESSTGSEARRTALANLENIAFAISRRHIAPRAPKQIPFRGPRF